MHEVLAMKMSAGDVGRALSQISPGATRSQLVREQLACAYAHVRVTAPTSQPLTQVHITAVQIMQLTTTVVV